ncbi:MAG: hypothetical protein KatS3mg100_070 [Candidatus Parcubacteria bacterium]|nr:MAG: hypothetical protein KatS3mg100_070 [Candidatus Parcubacteria bacterium]
MRSFVAWLSAQPRSHHLIALVAALVAAGGVALWWKAPALAPSGAHEIAPASEEAAVQEETSRQNPQQDETVANQPQEDSGRAQEGASGVSADTGATAAHPTVRRPVGAEVSASVRAQLEAAMAAAEAQPHNPEAWLNLGLVRKAAGDLEGAKEAWRYANELRPSYVLPLVNIGSVLALEEGKPEEAQNYFTLARERNPSYLFTYQQFADIFSGMRGEHGRAEAFLREGIARNEKSAALWLWLGEVLERAQGRGGDALYAFMQAREIAREDKQRAQEGAEPYRVAAAIEAAAEAGVARLGGE